MSLIVGWSAALAGGLAGTPFIGETAIFSCRADLGIPHTAPPHCWRPACPVWPVIRPDAESSMEFDEATNRQLGFVHTTPLIVISPVFNATSGSGFTGHAFRVATMHPGK